jgi:quinol monooxygenase YgiN
MSEPKVGLWVMLEAKLGKEAEVEKFLKDALPLAQGEAGTITWYAINLGPGRFGIFDTFADDAGRTAHLNGPIAKALMSKAGELLANPPKIDKLDLLAAKRE